MSYGPYSPPGSPAPGYSPAGFPQKKPGKVQAVAVLTLVGGIYALVFTSGVIVSVLISTLCIGAIWLPMYYGLVAGILATIKGSRLLGQNDRYETAPLAAGTMLIINIINCDVVNLVLGILILVFSNDPEVREYYQGR